MKTLMKRLRAKKGFTIVECIIAIAVFAALTLVVFMILTHARNSAVKANKAEEELTGLIENVIGDDSYKKFYSDSSESLVMNINNSTSDLFTVSYNKVNGYGGYVKCENSNCPYFKANKTQYIADGSQFMFNTTTNKWISNSDEFTTKDQFGNPSNTYVYKCPECEATVAAIDVKLHCNDCDKTDSYKKFGYDNLNHCYYCDKSATFSDGEKGCGGTNIVTWTEKALDGSAAAGHAVAEDVVLKGVGGGADFNISGLYANAIKYGDVHTPANNKDLFKLWKGTELKKGKFYLNLSYSGNNNHSNPGLYTMTITGLQYLDADGSFKNVDGSNPVDIEIDFPPYYDVKDIQVLDGVADKNNQPKYEAAKLPEKDTETMQYTLENKKIRFVGATSPIQVKITFRLANYKSGFSFEYDYNKSGPWLQTPSGSTSLQGLFAWFGINNGSGSIDRKGGEYAISATGFQTLIEQS